MLSCLPSGSFISRIHMRPSPLCGDQSKTTPEPKRLLSLRFHQPAHFPLA